MGNEVRARLRQQRSEELRGIKAKTSKLEVLEFSESHLRLTGSIVIDYWPSTAQVWPTGSTEASFGPLEPQDVVDLAVGDIHIGEARWLAERKAKGGNVAVEQTELDMAMTRITDLERENEALKSGAADINLRLGRALRKIDTYKLRDARIAQIRDAAKIFLEDFPGDL